MARAFGAGLAMKPHHFNGHFLITQEMAHA